VNAGAPAPLPPPRDATVVSQSNKLFSPQHVRLGAGRTLTVLNDDTRTHNVRIYDPRFDFNSGAQEPHETVTIRFPRPRHLRGLLRHPPSMRLTVEVK
jgi:cytochrome c peroxidase